MMLWTTGPWTKKHPFLQQIVQNSLSQLISMVDSTTTHFIVDKHNHVNNHKFWSQVTINQHMRKRATDKPNVGITSFLYPVFVIKQLQIVHNLDFSFFFLLKLSKFLDPSCKDWSRFLGYFRKEKVFLCQKNPELLKEPSDSL